MLSIQNMPGKIQSSNFHITFFAVSLLPPPNTTFPAFLPSLLAAVQVQQSTSKHAIVPTDPCSKYQTLACCLGVLPALGGMQRTDCAHALQRRTAQSYFLASVPQLPVYELGNPANILRQSLQFLTDPVDNV